MSSSLKSTEDVLESNKLDTEIAKSESQVHTKKPFINRFKSGLWDCLDYPPEQRRVILKIDFLIVVWGALSSFIKYLDKSNLGNAYNSGLKEYLNVKGNELNYANTAYNVASIICGFPAAQLMVKYNTKWFIVIIEVLWTIVTFGFVSIKTPFQMIVVRTILGIVECGHYSAFVFLIGTYYNQKELARRQVVLQSFTVLGPMFATYIQAGASSSLAGKNGYEGWQWTFLIDGIVSFFVIVPQIIFMPDILSRVKPSRFLSQEEITYLQKRLPQIKQDEKPVGVWNQVKEMLQWCTQWHVWAFWLFGVSQDIISLSNASTQFWIKGWNKIHKGSYTTSQINTLTSPMYAVSFATSLILGWTSDTIFKGKRWPGIIIAGLWTFPAMIALGKIPVYGPKGIRFFLYYQSSVAQGASGLYWGYAQEYYGYNLRLRAFVTGGINVWAYVANCICNNIWYKTADQPYISTGHYLSAFFCFVYVINSLALGWGEKKYMRKPQTETVTDEESDLEGIKTKTVEGTYSKASTISSTN
ncbi:hypothetical protein CANARDRAFT_214502 [[Candida] arabinofermentans NRRL YB-2248]|uniref:Major facilitator superfamily (MFS) profile domain-containing protein n=1 Tax=[Candida] arabinofermentans NRRL YB-2248 TaxID=983967 RepID=A0A1E4SV51_9ASCO|nr:hypothetical protein CANARDRAFT_214502 [[Candida] arabinofermentans NRRL YB-2248]